MYKLAQKSKTPRHISRWRKGWNTTTTRTATLLPRSPVIEAETNAIRPRGGVRSFSVRRGGRRGRLRSKPKKEDTATTASTADATTKTTTSQHNKKSTAESSLGGSTSQSRSASFHTVLRRMWERYLSPVRFMPVEKGGGGAATPTPGSIARRPLRADEWRAWAQRLPLTVMIAGAFTWDQTTPLAAIRLHGPSMLPTMAADQSEIWLMAPLQTIWRRYLFPPTYRRGDLVGFTPTRSASPENDEPNVDGSGRASSSYISCKRIVGLPGDVVRRYGAYVHLYVAQDPEHWGILWPPSMGEHDGRRRRDDDRDPRDTLVVPDGHVWVEADCPGLGLDSRQLGPIPVSAVRGRIVCRLWPLWRSKFEDPLYPKTIRPRPHPIPLDPDTLRLYNVHRITPPSSETST